MNHTLEEIIEIFENDSGVRPTALEKAYDQGAWEMLSEQEKEFLNALEREDLESICVGEARGSDDEPEWLIQGDWRKLPPAVQKFLNIVFEGMTKENVR